MKKTQLIHGNGRNKKYTAHPIYETSGFAFDTCKQAASRFALQESGPIYSRLGNPTVERFEERISLSEGGTGAIATSSGMSATLLAVLTCVHAGQTILASKFLYGGTVSLFTNTLKNFGIQVEWVESIPGTEDFYHEVAEKLPSAHMMFVESVSNPNLHTVNIKVLSALCNSIPGGPKVPLVVDNTFGFAGLHVQPLSEGAALVVHSATKWICGSGTTVGGVVVAGDYDWNGSSNTVLDETLSDYNIEDTFKTLGPITYMRVRLMRDLGVCLPAHSAQQLMVGLTTLPIRYKEHCKNCSELALFLQNELGWEVKSDGAMIAAVANNIDVEAFVDKLKLCTISANLGDCRTIVTHPASTTHSQVDNETLTEQGIGSNFIRISVGLEDMRDVIDDFKQALA